MFDNIYENVKVTLCLFETSDNETATGTILDMSGFEGVAFVAAASLGEAVSIDLKAQQGAASDMSDAADLAGTLIAMDPAVGVNGVAILDVYRPAERYVRPALVVANATVPPFTAIVALQYGARTMPVTQTITAEYHASPAEGTA